MNKERVQLLVDALRSGEFTQVLGKYRGGSMCFCGLGVMIEVYRQQFLPDKPFDCYQEFAACRSFGFNSTHLEAIQKANDKDRRTFPEIADMIEGWIT